MEGLRQNPNCRKLGVRGEEMELNRQIKLSGSMAMKWKERIRVRVEHRCAKGRIYF